MSSSISSNVAINTNCTECCPRKLKIFCCCCPTEEPEPCDKHKKTHKPVEKKVEAKAKSLFDEILEETNKEMGK